MSSLFWRFVACVVLKVSMEEILWDAPEICNMCCDRRNMDDAIDRLPPPAAAAEASRAAVAIVVPYLRNERLLRETGEGQSVLEFSRRNDYEQGSRSAGRRDERASNQGIRVHLLHPSPSIIPKMSSQEDRKRKAGSVSDTSSSRLTKQLKAPAPPTHGTREPGLLDLPAGIVANIGMFLRIADCRVQGRR